MKPLPVIAITGLTGLLLLTASAARADVGVESASDSSAAPGKQIRVTIGCGFCYPSCVGRPGHRHPPGRARGVCMLGGRSGPPTGFGIWLMPLTHSLAPYRCAASRPCPPGSSRPPHLPSFTYLGRAGPASGPGRLGPREIPRYVLRFRVPELMPGRYKYVIYCGTCVDGPRGSLVATGSTPAGRLEVTPPASSGGGGSHVWIAGGIVAAIALWVLAIYRGG